jgi:hypothetical protein
MENKYKKTFLTNVIVRVDFPNPLKIHENLPSILTKAILELFPISEPKKMIVKTIKFTPENKFEIEVCIELSGIIMVKIEKSTSL